MNVPVSLPSHRWPDLSHVVTEDGAPVDNLFSEKEMRLLTAPLYASWKPSRNRSFQVLSNVGLFNRELVAIVPDVMLGMDVRCPDDLWVKGHRSWFVHIVGKAPDAAVEIVSGTGGGEDSTKLVDYAALGVRYYVIHDPENFLKAGVLRGFELRKKKYVPIDPSRLPKIELGLVLWQGKFEDTDQEWLRWCDLKGNLILTGQEQAEKESERAEKESERAEKESERAEKESERAEKESERAEKESERAEKEAAKAARLAERLRALGVDPEAE